MSDQRDNGDKPRRPFFLSLPPMRYPNAYVWLVLLSALDIMLTYMVIHGWEGYEANPLAAAVFETKGLWGAALYKFALVVIAIVICEVVGRNHDRTGRRLAIAFVVISCIPVLYTFSLLFRHPPPLE